MIAPGTVIATFDKIGRYSGHAAIYLGQNEAGLQAFDQWATHVAQIRVIRFKGRQSLDVDDGDQYRIVEAAE